MVIDARKQRFYAALYTDEGRVSDYLDIRAADLCRDFLNQYQAVRIAGPDGELFAASLEADGTFCSTGSLTVAPPAPAAALLAEIGLRRYRSDGPDADDQGPLYIRPEVS